MFDLFLYSNREYWNCTINIQNCGDNECQFINKLLVDLKENLKYVTISDVFCIYGRCLQEQVKQDAIKETE